MDIGSSAWDAIKFSALLSAFMGVLWFGASAESGAETEGERRRIRQARASALKFSAMTFAVTFVTIFLTRLLQ